MNEARHTYEIVTSHMNEHTLGCHCVIRNWPCDLALSHVYEICVCVCMWYEAYLWNLCGKAFVLVGPYITEYLHMWHDSFARVIWLIHTSEKSDVSSHQLFIEPSHQNSSSHIHMCCMTHPHVWRDSFICLKRGKCHITSSLIFIGTHAYVWHDSFTCVTWHIHMCQTSALPCHQLFESIEPHSYVWHDSFTRVTWLIRMFNRTHSHVWHDSFACLIGLIHTCDWVTLNMWMSHVTRVKKSEVSYYQLFKFVGPKLYVWHDSFILWHVTDLFSSRRVLWMCRVLWSQTNNTWIIHNRFKFV